MHFATMTVGLMLVAQGAPTAGEGPTAAGPGAGWTPLFNGRDLSGWYSFLQVHGKNNDPDRIITIEDGMIRLYKHAEAGTKVVMGYIATEEEYGNYHLRFKYRWGEKKFEPRLNMKRDAGVFYHLIGEDRVWPRQMQFQIQETDVGDLGTVPGFQVDTWTDPRTFDAAIPTYLPAADGGRPRVMGVKRAAFQAHLRGNHEVEGWNAGEIIVQGDRTTHILNGTVVNEGTKMRQFEETTGRTRPLLRGRIALEIEAAEIDYRDIEIRRMDTTSAPRP
jgi:hypothetical protein